MMVFSQVYRVIPILVYTVLVGAFIPRGDELGALALILLLLLSWGAMKVIPKVVLIIALLTAALGAIYLPEVLDSAVHNVMRIASLIIAVMLLSSVLGAGSQISAISSSLFYGAPKKRYLGLVLGTSVLSIPLNFGSIAILGSLLSDQKRRQGDSASIRNASRAILRGFAATPLYSPLAISIALTLTLLPSVSTGQLLSITAPLSLLFILAGFRFRESEVTQAAPVVVGEADVGSWLKFATTVILICMGVAWGSFWFGWSHAHSVTVSCSVAAILSLLARRLTTGKAALPDVSNVGNELSVICGSVLIGSLVSSAITHLWVTELQLPMSSWLLIAALIPWFFFAAGAIGINPIVVASLVGGILGGLWPEETVITLAIAMVLGWGVTAAGTPYTVSALLLERVTGYHASVAAWQWNFKLSLLLLSFSSLFVVALTLILRV